MIELRRFDMLKRMPDLTPETRLERRNDDVRVTDDESLFELTSFNGTASGSSDLRATELRVTRGGRNSSVVAPSPSLRALLVTCCSYALAFCLTFSPPKLGIVLCRLGLSSISRPPRVLGDSARLGPAGLFLADLLGEPLERIAVFIAVIGERTSVRRVPLTGVFCLESDPAPPLPLQTVSSADDRLSALLRDCEDCIVALFLLRVVSSDDAYSLPDVVVAGESTRDFAALAAPPNVTPLFLLLKIRIGSGPVVSSVKASALALFAFAESQTKEMVAHQLDSKHTCVPPK